MKGASAGRRNIDSRPLDVEDEPNATSSARPCRPGRGTAPAPSGAEEDGGRTEPGDLMAAVAYLKPLRHLGFGVVAELG